VASLSTKRVKRWFLAWGDDFRAGLRDTRREHEGKQSTARARFPAAQSSSLQRNNEGKLYRDDDDEFGEENRRHDGCIISRARGSPFLHVLQVRLRKNEPFLDPDMSKCLFLCSSGTHTRVQNFNPFFPHF